MSKIKELVLQKAIKDPDFAREVLPDLPGKVFEDSTELSTVYTVLKRQLLSSSQRSNQETLALKVESFMERQKKDQEEITNTLSFLNDIYDVVEKGSSDETVDTEVENFVKAEMTKDAILKAVSRNDFDDTEKIGKLGDEITRIAVKNLSGTSGDFIDFFRDIDRKRELLSNMHRFKYSTGFKTLDTMIEGGISRGELATASGLTGGGKSMFISNLVTNYVKQGLNVMLVSLEELENRIVLRSEQQFLGINKSSILNEDFTLNEQNYEIIQETYKKQGARYGNYFISKHKPQEVTPSKLEQIIINTQIRENTNIDVVIVDYPELLKATYSTGSESKDGEMIYEFLRSMAQEHEFMCWTISQVNRTGSPAELLTKSHIEGSKRKLNSVELHITINQTDMEFQKGFVRLYLDKVRNGSGNGGSKVIPMKVIPETMTIRDCTEEERMEHEQIMDEYADGGVFNNQKKGNKESPEDLAKKFNSMM